MLRTHLSQETILLRTPRTVFFWMLPLAGLLVFLIGVLVAYWHEFTLLGRAWVASGATLILLVGIDTLQRRYEIASTRVAVRRMFIWRRRSIPDSVAVVADKLGRVRITDPHSHRLLLMLPREYNKNGALLRDLITFYRT